jgi:alpha-N-arabinofuranosidase
VDRSEHKADRRGRPATATADWIGWNDRARFPEDPYYLALHVYVGNTANDWQFLTNNLCSGPHQITKVINGVMLRRRTQYASPGTNGTFGTGPAGLTAWASHPGGTLAWKRLVVATFLNTFVNSTHHQIANMAQLVNVIAPIFTDEKRLFLQTIYIRWRFSRTIRRGKPLALVRAPHIRTERSAPHLDVSAALDNGTLVMNVVNRHRDQPVETDIELEDKQFSGTIEISEVNAPDIKAENNFESTTVKIAQRSARADKNTLRISFPPHSYTMLKTKLA